MTLEQPHFELLSLLILPFAAALVVAALGPRRANLVRWISFGVATVCLILSLVLAGRMVDHAQHELKDHPIDPHQLTKPTFRPIIVPGSTLEHPHATNWDLLPVGPGVIQFYIGLDGLNIWLVVLTGVLMMPAVLVSWNHITERINEFYAWLLLLQTAMLGIFLSFDIILFYVFFELSLVPLFFLIGIWGGPERRHAARKFFIYTLVGSVITLLGVLGVVLACYEKQGELTFSLPRLVEIVHSRLALENVTEQAYWRSVQLWVFLALMAGFAVKVPLVPFHTWLPLAHVEAPTAGSVDLAGVLLKVGAYGFLRLCLPLAPDVSLSLGLPLVTGLAAIGILYGAYCAYSQDDIKKLVAYSSVSHLGLCMLGMFALNVVGLAGSLMQMVNHGLSTAGLFLLVGMLYERYHTRKVSDYGGMAARLPLLGCFMVFICLTSIGLPGLNGFIGEVLVLLGIFENQWGRGQFPILAIIGASGMVLGAWYLMTMLQRVFFGPVKEPPVADHDNHGPIGDLSVREVATLVPVCILCIAIGVYPQPLLTAMKPDVQIVADIAQRARDRKRASVIRQAEESNTVPHLARSEKVGEGETR